MSTTQPHPFYYISTAVLFSYSRRQKWLKLIDREDLLQREDLKRSSHEVCSVHFEDSSIKIVKHLKKNALPSRLLHNQLEESSSCSEAESTTTRIKSEDKGKDIILSIKKEYVTVGTQTESLQSTEEQTQTLNTLTEKTSIKRTLSNKIREFKLKRRKLDQEFRKIKKELMQRTCL